MAIYFPTYEGVMSLQIHISEKPHNVKMHPIYLPNLQIVQLGTLHCFPLCPPQTRLRTLAICHYPSLRKSLISCMLAQVKIQIQSMVASECVPALQHLKATNQKSSHHQLLTICFYFIVSTCLSQELTKLRSATVIQPTILINKVFREYSQTQSFIPCLLCFCTGWDMLWH